MNLKEKKVRTHLRKAFTMIELVFVIVIMAILAKFGVEFLAQAYNNFIFSKINNELQSNSASSVEFISSRLQHRIKESSIMRNTTAGYPGTPQSLQNSVSDVNATVLEWISADIAGFRGDTLPYWSGIIDLDDSNATTLVSKETNTTAINNLINSLSDGNSGINNSAIYFIGSSPMTTTPLQPETAWGYDVNITDQNHSMHPITLTGQINQFIPDSGAINFSGVGIWEYYKLAWTAYAVELRDYNNTSNTGTLTLWYDYQPWEGEVYNTHGRDSIIMENVSSFQFRSIGSLIKIQVCTKSLLTNEEYSICKEKTVF
ncbi:type II secretion system protein [Sulfurimonas sp.]|uniref:type II secretion system protein n=1 Tax=Sulfurimonas sp. TaxID=2022749 RepID=UPI002AAFB704|nr:type II secretion system protein [Sulfurimonas sp.]